MSGGLPVDLTAERVLLRTVLEDYSDAGTAFHVVADLPPSAFYDPAHRLLWRAARAAAEAGRRVDVEAVRERLEAAGELEQAGGLRFLGTFADGVPRTGDVAAVGARLRELAALRGVAAALDHALVGVRSGASLADTREAVYRGVAEAERLADAGGTLEPGHVTREALDELEAEIMGQAVGLPTGVPDLDARLRGGGLLRGQLVYIGARPSRGKTALLTQVAEAASRAGRRVLFVSLEMPGREIQKRRLLAAAGVSVELVRRAPQAEREAAVGALARAFAGVARDSIRLTDNGARTVAAIRAECFRERAARGLDLVVVDYLGYITNPRQRASLYERTTENSNALHALAVGLDVPVVVGVQLNRSSEAHGQPRRPSLADFRDSGAVEQDADLAILIHQEGATGAIQAGPAELILAKNRSGWTGPIGVHFDADRVRFLPAAWSGTGEP